MCVIMSSGPGVPAPPLAHLENANEANPHGWGVAINLPVACKAHRKIYSTLGKPSVSCSFCRKLSEVIVERGFSTYDLIQSVAAADALRKTNPLSSLIVHTRIATGTPVVVENTHPFEVNETLHLFHNGIFSETLLPVTNKLKPDSWHLAQLIKPHMDNQPAYFLHDAFKTWLDDLCKIGYSNKILLLDAVAGPATYNTAAWVDGKEGRLYSNTTPLDIPWSYALPATKETPSYIDPMDADLDNPWGYGEGYYPSQYMDEVNPWEPLVTKPTTAAQLRAEFMAQKEAGVPVDQIVDALVSAKRGCKR